MPFYADFPFINFFSSLTHADKTNDNLSTDCLLTFHLLFELSNKSLNRIYSFKKLACLNGLFSNIIEN